MKEHDRAQAWRIKRNLTVRQLAELTGYGPRAINWYELGQVPTGGGRKCPEWIWQRYKNVCAGIESHLRTKKTFDW